MNYEVGAVVNWLRNNSVSIVNVEAIPSEARGEQCLAQVVWGRSTELARIVKISSNYTVLEEAERKLCESIEEMESTGVVDSKRKKRKTKKYGDEASTKSVAKATGQKPQLDGEQKKQKKVLTDKEKELMVFRTQAARKQDEELFAKLMPASQKPSLLEKSSAVGNSELSYIVGSSDDSSDSDSEYESEPEKLPESPDLSKFVKEYATAANIKFLRGLLIILEANVASQGGCGSSQAVYIPLKDLPANQAWEYLGSSAIKVSKVALLRVLAAGASTEARQAHGKKSKKKKKLGESESKAEDILAPSRAMVRKLLEELFDISDLTGITCYGTGKSRKGIHETILQAMFDYVNGNSPDSRQMSKGQFHDTINRKGNQLARKRLEAAAPEEKQDNARTGATPDPPQAVQAVADVQQTIFNNNLLANVAPAPSQPSPAPSQPQHVQLTPYAYDSQAKIMPQGGRDPQPPPPPNSHGGYEAASAWGTTATSYSYHPSQFATPSYPCYPPATPANQYQQHQYYPPPPLQGYYNNSGQ